MKFNNLSGIAKFISFLGWLLLAVNLPMSTILLIDSFSHTPEFADIDKPLFLQLVLYGFVMVLGGGLTQVLVDIEKNTRPPS